MLLNPFIYTSAVGSGGVSYFFQERFEGSGYQNSWTESGTGTIDEDYTTSPMEGSQGLRFAGTVNNPNSSVTFASDQGELWGFFRFRLVTSLSVTRTIFRLRDNAAATMGGIQLVATTNTITAIIGAQAATTTVDSLSTGTDYYFWWHWKKGTGANGTMSVGFNTTGTETTSGNKFSSKTNGTGGTNDVHDLSIGFTTTNTTGEFVIDQILISTTGTIGDNPV